MGAAGIIWETGVVLDLFFGTAALTLINGIEELLDGHDWLSWWFKSSFSS